MFILLTVIIMEKMHELIIIGTKAIFYSNLLLNFPVYPNSFNHFNKLLCMPVSRFEQLTVSCMELYFFISVQCVGRIKTS